MFFLDAFHVQESSQYGFTKLRAGRIAFFAKAYNNRDNPGAPESNSRNFPAYGSELHSWSFVWRMNKRPRRMNPVTVLRT